MYSTKNGIRYVKIRWYRCIINVSFSWYSEGLIYYYTLQPINNIVRIKVYLRRRWAWSCFIVWLLLVGSKKKGSHGLIKCVKVQGVNIDISRYIIQCNVKNNIHFVGDNTRITKSTKTVVTVVQSTHWWHTYQLVIMITKCEY